MERDSSNSVSKDSSKFSPEDVSSINNALLYICCPMQMADSLGQPLNQQTNEAKPFLSSMPEEEEKN